MAIYSKSNVKMSEKDELKLLNIESSDQDIISEVQLPAEDLVSPNDFKSIQLRLTIENPVTHTRFSPLGLFINDKLVRDPKDTDTVEFLEFIEETNSEKDDVDNNSSNVISISDREMHGLVAQIPKGICTQGHKVTITVTPIDPGSNSNLPEFTGLGRIADVIESDSHSMTVAIHFSQYKKAEWQAIKNIYSKRQQEIFDFFSAIKGT